MGLGTDSDAQDAVSGADALVVMTEAEEFKTPNWGTIKSLMRCQNLVDGRNIYDPKAIRSLGFTYRGVGR
jgi:UDPglucose 6-dehydrogenase